MFRYQACPDIKGSESGVERAECIARYKDDIMKDRETASMCFTTCFNTCS